MSPPTPGYVGTFARLRQGPQDRITVGHQTDRGLASLARTFRREIEDVDAGDLDIKRRPLAVARLRDIEREQELRAALRESWLARDGGFDCYGAWLAMGGLQGVIDGSAPPLCYPLAIELDRAMFLAGHAHALAWPDEENRGSVVDTRPLITSEVAAWTPSR